MGLTKKLAAIAGVTAKNISSLELIASKDVGAFLNAARIHYVAVIGVEGFRIQGDCAVPDMDAIADFSDLPHGHEMATSTIEEAERFIVLVSQPDMYFDFELEAVESDI